MCDTDPVTFSTNVHVDCRYTVNCNFRERFIFGNSG
jgi:hypothetical protein